MSSRTRALARLPSAGSFTATSKPTLLPSAFFIYSRRAPASTITRTSSTLLAMPRLHDVVEILSNVAEPWNDPHEGEEPTQKDHRQDTADYPACAVEDPSDERP